jgi:putative ABC transport system permease protein
MDPQQPIYAVQTLEEAESGLTASRRLPALLVSIFGAFALILAAVGVYGVVSYGVTQRTSEIGVRIALGASRGQVRGLIVRQAMLPVAIGAAAGLGAAIALGRLMSRLLFEVSAYDPVALGLVLTALALSAIVASWLPARRASALNPVGAMRIGG